MPTTTDEERIARLFRLEQGGTQTALAPPPGVAPAKTDEERIQRLLKQEQGVPVGPSQPPPPVFDPRAESAEKLGGAFDPQPRYADTLAKPVDYEPAPRKGRPAITDTQRAVNRQMSELTLREDGLRRQAVKFLDKGESPITRDAVLRGVAPNERAQFTRIFVDEAEKRPEKQRPYSQRLGQRLLRGINRATEAAGQFAEVLVGDELESQQEARNIFEREIQELRRTYDPSSSTQYLARGLLAAAEMTPLAVGSAPLAGLPFFTYWYVQAVPQVSDRLASMGLGEEEARYASLIAGVPYAVVEGLQRLLPGKFKAAFLDGAVETAMQAVVKAVKVGGKAYGREFGEEVIQEGITLAAGKTLEALDKEADVDWKKETGQSLEELKEAAGALLFMMAPGFVAGGAQAMQELQASAGEQAQLFDLLVQTPGGTQPTTSNDAIVSGLRGRDKALREIVEHDKTLYWVQSDGSERHVAQRAIKEIEKEVGAKYHYAEERPPTPEPEAAPAKVHEEAPEIAANPEAIEAIEEIGDRIADARVGSLVASAMKKAIRGGTTDFADFVRTLASRIGEVRVNRIGPVLENEWQKRRSVLPHLGDVRDVSEILETPKPVQLQPNEDAAIEESGISLFGIQQDAKRGLHKTGSMLREMSRRWLTTPGGLPDIVATLGRSKRAWVDAQLTGIFHAVGDFNHAAKQAYGRRIAPEELANVRRVLHGEGQVKSLPEAMREPVTAMRSTMDSLSSALIDEGVAQGDLALIIASNFNIYMHRSYQAFTDPKWARKVKPEVRNKAKAFIRGEFPNLSEEEIAGKIGAYLQVANEATNPIAFLASGKLGAKDLSLFKRKKGIPAELRALLGERENPLVNFAESAFMMANLLANHRFLATVRDEGLNNFFYAKPTVNERGEFTSRIAAEENQAMAPLTEAPYTTEYIKRAWEDSFGNNRLTGFWPRLYFGVNGFLKYGKTVLSSMTHVRNFFANPYFALAQGHWRAWHTVTSSPKAMFGSLRYASNKERRAYYRSLVERGVVGESVRGREVEEIIFDAIDTPSLGDFLDHSIKRYGRTILGGPTWAYKAEDDFWKAYGDKNEQARYRKAYPEWTDEQVEQRAAYIVRNTYPTYSMVPKLYHAIRKFPLFGMFVSFAAEVYRTQYKTLGIIAEEMKNPATKGIAHARLAGLLSTNAALTGLVLGVRYLMGVTRQEDEDKREFMPFWSENSQIIHLGKDEQGRNRYVDFSYTDPSSYIRKPVIAFMRGENWKDACLQSFLEAVEPFAADEILAKALIEIKVNRKLSGAPVCNPQDPAEQRMADILAHLGKAVEPGFITSMRRFVRGLTGQVIYGKKYDARLEALAMFGGLRISVLDIPNSMTFKVRDFNKDTTDASWIAKKVDRNTGASDDDLRGAYRRAESRNEQLFQKMHRTVRAAQRRGMKYDEMKGVLRDGMSAEKTYQLLTGDILEHGYLSDRIHLATDPSASKADKTQTLRLLRALGVDYKQALDLLVREQGWRNASGDKLRPKPITPPRGRKPSAFQQRAYRLGALYRD